MVEALVCAQDWLRASNNKIFIEDTILDIESLEEGMKELALEQPTIIIDETIDESYGTSGISMLATWKFGIWFTS
ncbi:hypothetical protein HanPI659440_Chr02g0092831 [Helianthus annuus]|nr:hypothetical protein HanPI659440_Chr02g0092831 [Helianthus annuus]